MLLGTLPGSWLSLNLNPVVLQTALDHGGPPGESFCYVAQSMAYKHEPVMSGKSNTWQTCRLFLQCHKCAFASLIFINDALPPLPCSFCPPTLTNNAYPSIPKRREQKEGDSFPNKSLISARFLFLLDWSPFGVTLHYAVKSFLFYSCIKSS